MLDKLRTFFSKFRNTIKVLYFSTLIQVISGNLGWSNQKTETSKLETKSNEKNEWSLW